MFVQLVTFMNAKMKVALHHQYHRVSSVCRMSIECYSELGGIGGASVDSLIRSDMEKCISVRMLTNDRSSNSVTYIDRFMNA